MLLLRICLLILSLSLAASSGSDDAWKNKRAADWTEEETKQILTASPWAAMVAPIVKKTPQKSGNRGGFGVGGLGIPGVRRRQPQPAPDPDSNPAPASDSPETFNMRWESALPIREAELKARETNAPVVDEDHYAVAVYGLPNNLAKDPKGMADKLKGEATIKRDGQKDLKPSHVDVIQRDDGVVIVFLFPRSSEITAKDSRAEFDAQIGPYGFSQAFHLDEMTYQGKIEL